MDKEYVGREEVIKILEHYDLSSGSTLGYHSGAIECAISEIEMLPAADVAEVRHGRWERTGTLVGLMNFKHFYRCTACGRRGGNTKTNYCPHCGCKMDKED